VVALRRAGEGLATVLLVCFVTFFFTSKMPGSEAAVICGPAGPVCVRHESAILFLNHPFFERFFHWLGELLQGNLGQTVTPPEPITSVLSSAYPITLELIIYSQVIAVVVAIPLAVWSALRANKLFDRISTGISFATLAVPAFIIGPLLVLIFTVKATWFPGPAANIPSIWSDPGQNLFVMFLPSLTLAVGSIAVYQRLLRADMVATLEEDFIVMARAKGLSTGRILLRHALRPSTFTTMTVAGIQVGSLITGAVIVETVFALHGLGSVLTSAVAAKDLPTVQVVTIIVAVFYIVCNVLIDFLYTVIDPRVRRGRRG